MSTRLPRWIEPLALAERGVRLSGDLPLADFARLGETLAGRDGQVSIDLQFDRDAVGRPVVSGTLAAEVRLVCQRCMDSFPLSLHTTVALMPVTEDRGDAPPDPFEFVLVPDEPVALADWIEDELILALPQIPRHPDGGCAAGREEPVGDIGEVTGRRNPFAALAALKSKPGR